MKKHFLLSLMALLLPLTTWADTGDGSFTITFSNLTNSETVYTGKAIDPGVKVTPVGENAEFVTSSMYDITFELTNGNNPDGKDVDENEIKEVGVYKVTVTPNSFLASAGFVAKSGSFTITPKKLTSVSVLSMEKVYGSDEVNFEVESLATADGALTGDELENAKNCLTYEVVGNKTFEDVKGAGVKDGPFEVKVSGIEVDPETAVCNYYYVAPSVGNTTISLTISPRPLTVAFATDKDTKEYDAEGISMETLASSDYITLGNVHADEQPAITLTRTEGTGDLKDADTYTLKVGLADNNAVNDNYEIATESETITYNITKVKLTITAKDDAILSKTYGETNDADYADQFDYATFVTGENYDSEGINLAMKAKIDGTESAKGEYYVYPYVNGDYVTTEEGYKNALTNYSIVYDDPATFTVNAKTITAEMMDNGIEDLTYQGQLFNAEDIVITDGDYRLQKGTDYDYVGTEGVNTDSNPNAGKDAGTQFKVKVSGKGNYTGTNIESNAFDIKKATLTITAKVDDPDYPFEREYDGTRTWKLTDHFDFDGFVTPEGGKEETPEDNKLSLRVKWAEGLDAGENKSIYLYLGETIQGIKSSGVYSDVLTNYTVNYTKATYTITKKDASFWVEGTKVKYNAGTQQLGYAIKSDGIINGEETTILGEATVGQKVAEGVTAKVVKNADTYDLEITNADELIAAATNYNLTYDDTKNTVFEIEKLPATVTAGTIDIAFGAPLPTEDELATKVKDYDWMKIDISNGTDRGNLRGTLVLTIDPKAESGETGSYELTIGYKDAELQTQVEKDVLNNYDITLNHGTLNIGVVNDITLDGSIEKVEDSEEDQTEDKMTVAQKVAKYNGATVKEVTIQNMWNFLGTNGMSADHTIKAKQWYTLTLPFGITVRDLSAALGYAIVNVPNTEKGARGAAYFKLEMDSIPANTLMAFKVDRDIVWDDNKTITFTNRTIEAPKDVWTTDVAGNVFQGVYEKTHIDGADNYIMWFSDGLIYPVDRLYGDKGVDVYPFNGYIHFVELADGEQARVYMEELDGSTTSISAVKVNAVSNAAEGWYTVGGVKLEGEPTQKGVYINNGKKVVIK